MTFDQARETLIAISIAQLAASGRSDNRRLQEALMIATNYLELAPTPPAIGSRELEVLQAWIKIPTTARLINDRGTIEAIADHADHIAAERTLMNSLILCTAATLNISSAPAGNTVVGEVPAYQRVYLMEGSLMRSGVFMWKPGRERRCSPRSWVIYAGLGQCQ